MYFNVYPFKTSVFISVIYSPFPGRQAQMWEMWRREIDRRSFLTINQGLGNKVKSS